MENEHGRQVGGRRLAVQGGAMRDDTLPIARDHSEARDFGNGAVVEGGLQLAEWMARLRSARRRHVHQRARRMLLGAPARGQRRCIPQARPRPVEQRMRGLRAAHERRHDRDAVEAAGYLEPGQLRKRGQHVPKRPAVWRDASRDGAGPTHHGGRAHATFVERTLVAGEAACRVEEEVRVTSLVVRAVVACKDNERALLELELLQRAHELTHLAVEVGDHRRVISLDLRPRAARGVLAVGWHRRALLGTRVG
eukprot:scaffold70374_cov65-Phaeocystis_antarctica.AAC.3